EVRRINFVGNRVYSDGRLRSEILTSESAWWRFLSTSDNYDPDRLAFDQERLRRFYLGNGYADFEVRSVVAELSPVEKNFFITFTVNEGPRYKVGKVDVTSAIPDLAAESVAPVVEIESGDWYDSEKVEEAIESLTDAVGNQGYAFVDIRPEVQRNAEAQSIDLTFAVQEGPRVFVERIDIVGNVRTLDRVIRREMNFVEGDAFNRAKVRRSRRNIQNLGYFKAVEIAPRQGGEPDQAVVEIEVEEQSTGSLSFGVGFSTADGALAEVSLQERNLLGRGQTLRLGTTIAAERTRVNLGFTEPYLFDMPLSGGVDLFFDQDDRQDESSFNEERLGSALRLGYDIAEDLRHTVGYRLVRSEIDNIDDDASLFIKNQAGSSVTSALSQSLTYDRRDNRILPNEGYRVQISNEVAGIGGSVRYLRYRAEAQYLYPLVEDRWILSFDAATGWIEGLNQDLRIVDRFFLGGGNLRGFESAGVGPRDRATDDALGGRMFYSGSVSLRYPLEVFDNAPLNGRLFTDFGSLWSAEESGPAVQDVNSLRMSIGTGITWRAPVGLISVDLAKPILKEDFDEEEIFRFSFGTQF
ncbi:MAG: outer membrane protein assembly factor BamA, partial [Acetobacterales bacterium]